MDADLDLSLVVDAAEDGRLDALIAAWSSAADERALLARALRLDLSVLRRHPALALPCLYRWCAWGDPALAARIRDAAEAWRRRGRSWLRALRPPPVPIESAVVEERRGAVDLAGWRGSDFALTERLRLTLPDDVDVGRNTAVVDTRTGQTVWECNAETLSAIATPDGARLFALLADRVQLLALDTGATIATWPAHDATSLAMAPDFRTAATTHRQLVRIWDVERALATPQPQPASRQTWTEAQFSPDGAHLVTGDLLCDGVTGEIRARLELNGPGGWLEGGPVERCQWVCDGLVVEIHPFRLSAWNARDGQLQLREQGRGVGAPAEACVSPDGRLWAHNRDRLVLGEVRGPDRFETPIAATQLGFSDDGELLHYTADGARWSLPTAPPHRPVPGPPPRPALPPRRVVAGLLHFEDTSIPDDGDAIAVSSDGNRIATRFGHYAMERAGG